jgi:hypothetical protein
MSRSIPSPSTSLRSHGIFATLWARRSRAPSWVERLRDEVLRRLQCSELEAEQLIDTMIMRGFVAKQHRDDGWVGWTVLAADE